MFITGFLAVAACTVFGHVHGAPDNRGTEFIIGYMENIAESMNVELFVTTMKTTTVSVTVTAPKYSSAGINSQFTVTAGQVKQLFFSPRIRMSGSSFSSKGVLVSATDEVVIYGVNKETYSCDAFLGLPTDVLAKEYYAITYYPPQQQCELMVVGVHDSTSVSIKFGSSLGSQSVSYGGRTYRAGNTLTVTMNRYDTIQLVSRGDLSGSYITGTKAISVFSGNKKTNIGRGGSSDHLVEHLTPVDSWGKKFATVPVPLRTVSDYWRFIGSEANTRITISGGYSTSFTIGEGQMIQKTIPSTAYCYITSDKPILVVQFCLSQQSSYEQSDPMMMIIPPVEQYGADYTFATPKYSLGSYSNYFMFVVKESEKSGLRLDGNAFPSNTRYNRINIDGVNYVGGYVSVSEGSHSVRHTSPISIFGGYLYGQARYETYGFTTGMRMAAINTVCVPTTQAVGDGIDNDCDGLIDEELCTTENQGRDDDGDGRSEEDCATPPPIDGIWTDWASWTSCSVSCKTSSSTRGTSTRTRLCNNPAPKYDGKQCAGTGSESKSCTPANYCPVHGNWGSWGSYASCTVTCATGTQTRTRLCNNPSPNHGGNQCSGSGTDTISCTLPKCPTWVPLLKVAHGQSVSPASSVYNLWTGTYTLNEYDSSAMSFSAGTKSYKSSVVDKWSSHDIDLIRVSFYSGGRERAWVVFNAAGSNKNSWFSCSKILYASFSDLNSRSTNNFCSVTGDSGHNRRFYLNKQYGGCNGDVGWFAVVEGSTCGWEQKTSRPYFLYSDASGSELSNNMALADVYVISADMDLCNPNPCKNGGSCTAGSTRYVCQCTGTYKGMACQDRDGVWASWASWGSCTRTCGGGTKSRSRSCSGKAGAGSDCPGSSSSSTSCNTHSCAVHGNWGSWANWGVCSKTCGTGSKARSRNCDNPAPLHGGRQCAGSGSDSTNCNTHHCPIDGKWGSWAAWGSCSKTCAGGTKNRKRACNNPAPQYGGSDCPGSSSSSTSCNTHHCPIDGEWTVWTSWSSCTLTCKDYGTSQTGTRYKQRSCTNPTPQYNGKDCVGMDAELSVCTTNTYCKIHGGWTDWTVWTACSVTCASGTKTRQRSCSNPTTRFGGTPCAGSTGDSAVCTLSPCPIDGKWTSWTSWGTCTVSCGGGTTTRTRSCTNPAPRYNGANCVGATSGTQDCNTQVCIIDGDWSNWQAWSPCTVTCGGGNRYRMRTCTNPVPKNGGLPCSGDTNQIETCSNSSCPAPIAGVYQQRCPNGWFTCNSGAMKCIQQAFVCDCDNDCEDGSDEDVSYAQCDAALVRFCQNSANGLHRVRFVGAVVAVLTSLLIRFL